MHQETFLGTPLTKYDIEDIEVDYKHEKARNFHENKGLIHKQNRERIRKNRLNDLYTVDTKEGWMPSAFKSSRLNRASYKFQRIDNFVDDEDNDIVSRRVLVSLDMNSKRSEISRIVKNIMNNYGYLKRIVGPQLPDKDDSIEFRNHGDYRGIGYMESQADDNEDRGIDKWIKSQKNECAQRAIEEKDTNDWKTYHKYDRHADLEDIKRYYSEYYDLIVKPIEEGIETTKSVDDLLEQYTKKIEFTTHSKDDKKDKICGRTEVPYTFTPELLAKFKIKSAVIKEIPKESATDDIEDDTNDFNIPFQLFIKIFNK